MQKCICKYPKSKLSLAFDAKLHLHHNDTSNSKPTDHNKVNSVIVTTKGCDQELMKLQDQLAPPFFFEK